MGADEWVSLMRERVWMPGPEVSVVPGPLADGQHRLEAHMSRAAYKRRQRRIVRVATLKYRSRRRSR